MSEASPLILSILCEHEVAGVSLMDSASRLVKLAGNAKEESTDHELLRSCTIFALDTNQWEALAEIAAEATNPEMLIALGTLLTLKHDWEELLRNGIVHLSQWRERERVAWYVENQRALKRDAAGEGKENEEGKGDLVKKERVGFSEAQISDITRDILRGVQGPHHARPSMTAPHEHGYEKAAEAMGDFRFFTKVAAPIANLFMSVMTSELYFLCGAESDTASLQPDILVKSNNGYCLCSCICSEKEPVSDEEDGCSQQEVLEEAWEKAVVSSMALTPQTASSTVVMAARDTYVRIGLLTLLDEVEYLSEELQGALRGAGAQVMLDTDDRTLGSLKLVNRVEFEATHICNNTLRQYFLFVTEKMRAALEHTMLISSVPGVTSAVECKDINPNFCPPDFPRTFIMHTAPAVSNVAQPSSPCTQQMDSGKVLRWGLFYTQYISNRQHRAYACFATHEDHKSIRELLVETIVPGKAYHWNTPYTFARVCAAVIHLHDTMHVCHGNIERGSVIVSHHYDDVALIGNNRLVGSMPPNDSLASVQALRLFLLENVHPSHREYVETHHWLFHQLADVLAVFQRVWWGQQGVAPGGTRTRTGEEIQSPNRQQEAFNNVMKVVIAGIYDQRDSASPEESRLHRSPSTCISTKDLMLEVLRKCEKSAVLKRWFAGIYEAVEQDLTTI